MDEHHENARLTVHSRTVLVKRIVLEGLRTREAAQAQGVGTRTAYRWLQRYRAEGWAGLAERSLRPTRCPHQIQQAQHERIMALRRERRTYRHIISQALDLSQNMVARRLKRADLNRHDLHRRRRATESCLAAAPRAEETCLQPTTAIRWCGIPSTAVGHQTHAGTWAYGRGDVHRRIETIWGRFGQGLYYSGSDWL